MTIDEIIEENRELQQQYIRALNTIAKLEKKIEKLERENRELREENEKLRKQNNVLLRAIEIAAKMKNPQLQIKFLKEVLKEQSNS